jgi:threonine aldolase
MSGYTSGNNAPTLMAQMPNRKGNASTHVVSHDKGATAVTGKAHGISYGKGAQGAPAFAKATSNTSAGATAGRKQKVTVQTQCTYDGKIQNDGYLKNSSYLK